MTVYRFRAGYTRAGVGAVPSGTPSVNIVTTSNILLIASGSAQSIGNMPGAYYYDYTGASSLYLIAQFITADSTIDQPSLFSVDSSALVLEAVSSLSIPTAVQVDTQLTLTHGTGSWGGGGSSTGSGSISVPITITVNSVPKDGVQVWITTDIGGTNTAASGTTNASGLVTFQLDAGTYYVWKQYSGVNFSNPDTLVVT